MLCGQRKSHRTRTKQWNPSVMFSSITHNSITAIVCSQHTRLVSSNHLCCYRSSHTFPITDLFASYHTHLVHSKHFCSHVSTQTVHLSESHAVYRTHLSSSWPFLLCCLITNSSSEWVVCFAHTFIWLPVSFVPPRRKRLIELNRMPCIAHATKIWTVFDASSIANVFTFFDGFHTALFAIMASHTVSRRVSDRSVALVASCSSVDMSPTYL